MLDTKTNYIKKLLKQGEPTAGSWIQTCSPIAAEIAAMTGLDWVLIDMEHSPLSFETLLSIVQAVQSKNAVPFVRAPWNDFVAIKRILDTGVYGVLVPYVNTKEEAEMAVKACKFPPLGIRGIAVSPRGNDYGMSQERIKRANDEICIIVQIETMTAVENIDEILKVEGLDGVFIGPADLSASMGYLCNPKHPEVQKVIAGIEEKVKGSDKFLGTVCSGWEEASDLYDRGYQFITVMADGGSIAAVGKERMEQFYKKFPNRKKYEF
jgi:2-dehydro-3-deoxyglucarate aldolase/4-hydroxy-2-oxoheptanedioate aldolase